MNLYLYITYKDSLTYDKKFLNYLDSHSRNYLNLKFCGKIQQKFKSMRNLIINGKIIEIKKLKE